MQQIMYTYMTTYSRSLFFSKRKCCNLIIAVFINIIMVIIIKKYIGDKSAEEIWKEHLTKKSLLLEYASCMHKLATDDWAKKHDNNRIAWCVGTIREYFHVGLRKALLKDLRRLDHGMPTIVNHKELPKTEQEIAKAIDPFISQPTLRLLDVGSCYNPFVKFEEFEVVAVDIAPAVEVGSVLTRHPRLH